MGSRAVMVCILAKGSGDCASTAYHDQMNIAPVMDDKSLSTNLLFWHRGVIAPHSGIGEHFHNRCEEMFVILSGEAEFTINGRTSLLFLDAGRAFFTLLRSLEPQTPCQF
jgi:mannose-6-phosphate isomerase-like protein (cupin superfamily)